MNVEVTDQYAKDEQFFSAFPQPPELAEEDRIIGHVTINDEYLTSLEAYIEDLGQYIRDVQKREVSVI